MKRSLWARRILLFIVIAPLAILVFGSVVMLQWNYVLTPVLNVSTITFWQGLGILILSKILFSSFGGQAGYRRDYWKQRMMWDSMTAEQKEKFKEEWKNRSPRWGYKNWKAVVSPEMKLSSLEARFKITFHSGILIDVHRLCLYRFENDEKIYDTGPPGYCHNKLHQFKR